MQNNMYNHDGPGLSNSGTANYTLPGIMQYLQSQFTLVERNRLQGELERSSLKLKIIELENERNSLLRKNKQLEITVDDLRAKLESSNLGNTSNPNETKSKDSFETDVLKSMHSTDVSKIIEARKFLKSATNEILYLLKTPTIEFENIPSIGGITGCNVLVGNGKENDLFYNHPLLTTETLPSDKETEENERIEFQENVEKHLNDIIIGNDNISESDAETIIDENIESDSSLNIGLKEGVSHKDNDEDDDDDDDEDDGDDDFDDDEFDDEDADDVEYIKHPNDKKQNNNHKAVQKEKLLHLLKKSPKKAPNNQDFQRLTLSIKLEQHPNNIQLVGDQIVVQFDETLAIYNDIFNGGKLVKTINKPEQTNDIKVFSNYIAFSTNNSVTLYLLVDDDIKLHKELTGLQGVDIESDTLLAVTDSAIEILHIKDNFKQVAQIPHNIEGDFVDACFVKGISTFDIAVLTSTILYLFDSKTAALVKAIPLSHYELFLLTSKSLFLKFDHGYSVLNYDNCTEFKTIGITDTDENVTESIQLFGTSKNVFALTRKNEETKTTDTKLFEVGKLGNVSPVADFPLKKNVTKVGFGETSLGPTVCMIIDDSIELQHVTL